MNDKLKLGEQPASDEPTVVTMPDETTMFAALRGVMNEPHACERLYPLICQQLASSQKMATGVVMGLHLAIHDYAQDLPSFMGGVVSGFMPSFIEAITPEEIRTEALEFWQLVSAKA